MENLKMEKWLAMFVVVTSFTNDENARPPTLLKMESTTDTLIDQGHRFKTVIESLWKATTVLQKHVF